MLRNMLSFIAAAKRYIVNFSDCEGEEDAS